MNKNNKKRISGWANFPTQDAEIFDFDKKHLPQAPFIPQGNQRSYGDSALNSTVVSFKKHNLFLDFNEQTGVLRCQSGVLLKDIIQTFLPRGWFPAVCPGTQLITLGGAIASDVHGKNHHQFGAFSKSVVQMLLLTPQGEIIECSANQNQDWFRASCGGMGLTGLIVEASIQLKPVQSQWIQQSTRKTQNLEETFAQFENLKLYEYSVAWIDCLAQGKHLGRGLVSAGNFCQDDDLELTTKKKVSVPFNLPNFTLNPLSLKILNTAYFHRVTQRESEDKVHFESFFFPLDAIQNWNRGYGQQGFLQYQFVLPYQNSLAGMKEILAMIALHKQGSTLAVLKLMGAENDNWLSFPQAGYTLALDFKNTPKVHALLKLLDQLVLKYGGRFYLAKDARLDAKTFEQGYPNIERFREFRLKHNLGKQLQSAQSLRLKL